MEQRGDLGRTGRLTGGLLALLAVGAGLGVAGLYFCQPMLGVMREELGLSEGAAGMIPMFTQLGYAAGILLLSPLGDRWDRRWILLIKVVGLTGALVACGAARGLAELAAASVALGVCATLAQDLVPAAAILAPERLRGRKVGTVMMGLLLGILLSRVVSGVVAGRWGWRAVYLGAAVVVAGYGLWIWRALPGFAATTNLGYGALLASMGTIWRRHGRLRQAVVSQALLGVAFSGYWSVLALVLARELGLGSEAAGAFGLAGAVGAVAAPLAGRMADRRGPVSTAKMGCGVVLASFATLWLWPWLGASGRLGLLAAVAVVFDFGVQTAAVSHQTIVYGAEPEARSRANAVLITALFVGLAAGSAVGGVAVARWGWMGLAGVTTGAAAAATAVRWAPERG